MELKVGIEVKTKWGWDGLIEKIEPNLFNQKQGITVKRNFDGNIFSISLEDINSILNIS